VNLGSLSLTVPGQVDANGRKNDAAQTKNREAMVLMVFQGIATRESTEESGSQVSIGTFSRLNCVSSHEFTLDPFINASIVFVVR
jgi:hypothetical protein